MRASSFSAFVRLLVPPWHFFGIIVGGPRYSSKCDPLRIKSHAGPCRYDLFYDVFPPGGYPVFRQDSSFLSLRIHVF